MINSIKNILISLFLFIATVGSTNILMFWALGWEWAIAVMAIIGFNNWFVKKLVEGLTGKTLHEIKMESRNK